MAGTGPQTPDPFHYNRFQASLFPTPSPRGGKTGEGVAALEGLLLEKTAPAKPVLHPALTNWSSAPLGSWPPIALPAERGAPTQPWHRATLALTPKVGPTRILPSCRSFRKGLPEEKAASLFVMSGHYKGNQAAYTLTVEYFIDDQVHHTVEVSHILTQT